MRGGSGCQIKPELNREILEPAERAEWLGLAIDPGPKLRLERAIDRFDRPIIPCRRTKFCYAFVLSSTHRRTS